MFGIIKKLLIVLLTSIVNGCNNTKCVYLNNQTFEIQPTLINLHPNGYNQEVLIPLMTYVIKYVFQIKQKI